MCLPPDILWGEGRNALTDDEGITCRQKVSSGKLQTAIDWLLPCGITVYIPNIFLYCLIKLLAVAITWVKDINIKLFMSCRWRSSSSPHAWSQLWSKMQ